MNTWVSIGTDAKEFAEVESACKWQGCGVLFGVFFCSIINNINKKPPFFPSGSYPYIHNISIYYFFYKNYSNIYT